MHDGQRDGERFVKAMRLAAGLMLAVVIPSVIVAVALFAYLLALATGVR